MTCLACNDDRYLPTMRPRLERGNGIDYLSGIDYLMHDPCPACRSEAFAAIRDRIARIDPCRAAGMDDTAKYAALDIRAHEAAIAGDPIF